jgi:tRNA-modifying protein YgfZ
VEARVAVIARDDVRVIEVTGADRLGYLDAVTTQRFADVQPGEVRGALVLDAHGAPLAQFWVIVHAERLALLAPPASATHVLEVLARRTFLSDATFAAVDLPVWSVRGDDVDAALAEVDVRLPVGRWRPLAGGLVARHHFGAEILGEEAHALLAGVIPAATDLDAARIATGEPVFGREVAPPHLPEELGLLPSHVHLSKGCYPGQEAVARMWMLGRPRRRLARVAVHGDVDAGWTLGAGKQAVTVTAVADGHGLAFVPADAAVGDRFGDEAAGVAVLDLVGADLHPVGWDPAQQRRRDR